MLIIIILMSVLYNSNIFSTSQRIFIACFFLGFQSLWSVLFHTWKVVLNNVHGIWQTVEALNDVIFLHGRFRFLLAVREDHFNLVEAELFPVCLYFCGVVLLEISKKTRTLFFADPWTPNFVFLTSEELTNLCHTFKPLIKCVLLGFSEIHLYMHILILCRPLVMLLCTSLTLRSWCLKFWLFLWYWSPCRLLFLLGFFIFSWDLREEAAVNMGFSPMCFPALQDLVTLNPGCLVCFYIFYSNYIGYNYWL